MPTKHRVGRPLNPWRPRKLEQDYIDVSQGFTKPDTKDRTRRSLRVFGEFLRRREVGSDAFTIHDIIAWEGELVQRGFRTGEQALLSDIRSYVKLRANREPESRWSRLAAEITVHRMPHVIGKRNPHLPFKLALLPKILEASRHVKQSTDGRKGRREIYSEVFTFVATLLYSGGRAQWYALRDDQVEAALESKAIELFVKEGEHVFVPVHDKLLAIWKDHLDHRDFEGPMFFRYGRYPYNYQDGSTDWLADHRAAASNRSRTAAYLGGRNLDRKGTESSVESCLSELYGVQENITAHRFRESMGSFMGSYGFTEHEIRLQLSHGARTITQHYTRAFAGELQKKLSQMDLGSAEWVAAHDPPQNLFANGNGHDEDLVVELRAQLQKERDRSDRLEQKIDELLARKVVA